MSDTYNLDTHLKRETAQPQSNLVKKIQNKSQNSRENFFNAFKGPSYSSGKKNKNLEQKDKPQILDSIKTNLVRFKNSVNTGRNVPIVVNTGKNMEADDTGNNKNIF